MLRTAPLLSIVIVAYKSRDEIVGCLASLPREVEGRSVEAIVVDNSPADGAGDLVRRQFPWVRYVTPATNLGFGRANNVGYRKTDPAGEFVLFLNPDTVCNAAALSHCVRRLQADLGIGLISPKLVLADGSMDLACRRSIPSLWDGFCRAVGLAAAFPQTALFSGYNLTHLPESGSYAVGAINGAFMMGRREVFERIGQQARPDQGSINSDPHIQTASQAPVLSGDAKVRADEPVTIFDETFFMYGDDLDLCIRIAKAGWTIVYDGSVTITHLKGLSVAKDYHAMSRAIFDANREVYLKHFNPRQSRVVACKYALAFGAWKALAHFRSRLRTRRVVRPL